MILRFNWKYMTEAFVYEGFFFSDFLENGDTVMFQRIIKQLLPSNHREAQFNRLMSATEPCSKTLINSSADAEFRNLLFCLDRSQYAENTLPYIL